MLLGDRLAPITYSLGFLEAPFDEVVSADQDWRISLGGYSWQRVSGSFEQLLRMLDPLSAPVSRHIWIATRANWTAFFDNFINGSDPFGPISYLAEKLKCRGVIITSQPNTPFVFGACRIEIYGPAQKDWLNLIRAVSAINDGGRWVWNTTGEVQPFEDTTHYKARRVKDRLTPKMLQNYCQAIGIEAFEEMFFGNEGFLVKNESLAKGVRVQSIRDTRNTLRLD
jgi:hypothetical protein